MNGLQRSNAEDRTMFSTLLKDEVIVSSDEENARADSRQHSKRKRIFAERYAMTNIMKEKPIAAITERASVFVSKCAAAGRQSVDVYVGQILKTTPAQLKLC